MTGVDVDYMRMLVENFFNDKINKIDISSDDNVD